jgi:hypothetical protein
MTNNWPVAPLIRIKRGLKIQEEIRDELAIRNTNGSYMTQKYTLYSTGAYNVIDEWEDVTPVPTAALKHLRDVFLGVELPLTQFAAIQQVVSHLPADKPSPLDRAADLARKLKGPRVTPDDTTSRRLAILLEAISFTHASPCKEAELTEIARTCADWLYIMNPNRVGLDDIETSAREIDRIPDDEENRYMSLTYRFAQAATLIGEGDHGGQEIMELGAYALAWAAQIIEEEDAHD